MSDSKQQSRMTNGAVPFPPRQLASRHREIVVLPGDFANQRQLWGTLWARRGFILRFALVFTVLFSAFTLLGGLRFLSTGQLYLGEISMVAPPPQAGNRDFGLNEGVLGLVASEMEILQSVSLVRRAVLESGVNATISEVIPRYAPVWYLPYWRWLVTGRRVDTVDAVRNVVRPTSTELPHNEKSASTFTVAFTTPTEYELHDKDSGAILGHGTLGTPLKTSALTMTLESGPWGPPRPGARYDVEVSPLDKVIDKTLSRLKVTVPKQTTSTGDINVVTVEYSNPSPEVSADFLQRLMSAYLEARQSWKTEDASAAETFVTGQIGGIRESLDQLQTKLAEYRRGNPSVVLDDQTKAMVEEIGKYEELRAKTQLDAAAFAQIKRVVQNKDAPMGAFLVGETQDPVLENMAEELAASREKLADFKARYNDAAPEVRQQAEREADQVDALRAYVEGRSRRSAATLQSLDAIIAGFDNRLKMVPAAALGLAQLQRESEVYSKTYAYLLERQQEAAIFKASTLSKNRVLYAPEVPIRVDSPNLLLRSLGLLAGLILAAGVVLARALFGASFHSVSDVRKSVVGVPVLATIAPAGAPTRARQSVLDSAGNLAPMLDVTALPVTSQFAEAFRTLRATLLSWGASAGSGIVALVTSPQAGDGKTTFTLALAGALSASGKTVLVVDADLRREAPEGDQGEANGGLSAVLRGEGQWQANLTRVVLASGSFHVLPSGGPDAPEILTTQNVGDLLGDFRGSFDFVLIDSPSFPAASDALVLAQLADVTFSLVRVERTPRTLTAEHLNELASHAADVALVINDASGTGTRPPKKQKKKKNKVPAREAAAEPWQHDVAPVPLAFRGVDGTVRGSNRS
jgi:tyrosine-protein kinase Etk/Wzc